MSTPSSKQVAAKAEEEESYDELDYESAQSEDEKDAQEEQRKLLPGYMPEQGLIKGALQPYLPRQYSTFHINQLVQAGDIKLDPEYQREIVWPEAKQCGLIDSLFHNYYIPPILFAVRRSDSGEEKRICIDGKQRLTSIYLFMTGQICWKPKTGAGKGFHYWYTEPQVRRVKIAGINRLLPQKEKGLFEFKIVQCAEFQSIPEDAERDIFQRVQLGMSLSPAEKLQAIASPYSAWISLLLKKWIYGPGKWDEYYSAWDKARARDFSNVAIMVMLITQYPAEKTSLAAIQVANWLNRADPVEDSLRKKIDNVFGIYLDIVKNYQDAAFNTVSNKLSPIEFSFAGLVIYVYHRQFNSSQLAMLIGQMRSQIRLKHKDVRANTGVTKDLFLWLKTVPKPKRVIRANEEDELETEDGEIEDQPRSKRARRGSSEDGDYYDHGLARFMDRPLTRQCLSTLQGP